MAPALLRFYGGSKDWEAVSFPAARRYYDAIPRIRATESFMPSVTPESMGIDFAKIAEEARRGFAAPAPKKGNAPPLASLGIGS